MLQFKPLGPASFSTWLRAVVRNLCLDWHRREFGQTPSLPVHLPPVSVFDQEVFKHVYERGVSARQRHSLCFNQSSRHGPPERVAESRDRIEQQLTADQRWRLGVRSARRAQGTGRLFRKPRQRRFEIADPRPNPEALAILEERRGALGRALARLSKRERSLVRLRFEQELTLEQIARLLNLETPSAQTVKSK